MVKKSASSRQWLKKHFTDPYVKQAQKEGYRSRAVYKLLEIQEKDRLIKPGMNIVELGAAPGGWSQILVKLLAGQGKIIALDILPMEPLKGVNFIQGDFTSDLVFQALNQKLENESLDLVLSDMAPNFSGIGSVDQLRTIYLAELALEFALKHLSPEGSFLVKVFQGEGIDAFLKLLKQNFIKVFIRKPKASRKDSAEVYLLARGKKIR